MSLEQLMLAQADARHKIEIGMRCTMYWLRQRARDTKDLERRVRAAEEFRDLPEAEEAGRLQVMDDWRWESEKLAKLQQREHEARLHREALEALGALEKL